MAISHKYVAHIQFAHRHACPRINLWYTLCLQH